MVENIQKASNHKMGFLTWYDCRDVHVTPSTLKMLFDRYGLDEQYLPEDIKNKNAFQKAIRKSIAEFGKNSDDRRSIAKMIVDGMDRIIYGIVDLNVQESQESIEPDFSDKIWLNKGSLTVEYQNNHELSLLIKSKYDQLCGEYTTRDISRMIVKTMDKLCSVPLRDAGVIYFVPIAFQEKIYALQKVINDLGASNMRIYSLGSDNGNSAGVQNAAKSQIQDKINSLKSEISDLKTNVDNGSIKGRTIENSIEVRRRKFNELKLRCQILSDALRIKADTLEGDLQEVDSLLKAELEDFVSAA